MKLSGWQRIGIVATGAWIVAWGLWIDKLSLSLAPSILGTSIDTADCSSVPRGLSADELKRYLLTDPKSQREACLRQQVKEQYSRPQESLVIGASSLLLPVIAGWLVGWIGLRLTRWVMAGFRSN